MNKDPLIYAVNSVRVELAARLSVIQEPRRVGGPAQSRHSLDEVMSLWALVELHVSTLLLSNKVQVDRTAPSLWNGGGGDVFCWIRPPKDRACCKGGSLV